MTDVNHLQEAKFQVAVAANKDECYGRREIYGITATAYALIAIAEQLEYNNKLLYAHAVNKNRCKVCGHLSDKEDK